MKLHLTFLKHEHKTLMTHSYHVSACSMYSRIQHCSSHLHWVVLQHSTDTQYNLRLSRLRWSLFSAFEKHLLFFLYECSRFYHFTEMALWTADGGQILDLLLFSIRSAACIQTLQIRKNTSRQVRIWGHTHRANCSIAQSMPLNLCFI